ncbi:Gfo/Idh/MocA family protein [Leifsonia sp. Root112D2]|uniref:Gfo/Idh/MocA family protein n=1 Tax=Leifsonia sp. Root112D2 TaxID=1736426 RepID=UPI000AAC785C|nr:Gfo/Idh/MocA family oxidoreductase [Leifsonia sp. Root112D2]
MSLPEFSPAQAYTLALPRHPRPIVVLGAGGIVRDAHLPAYKKAGLLVVSLCDRDVERAQALADEYGVKNVFSSIPEAVAAAPDNAVFDIALVPDQFAEALRAVPDGSAVLLQKPLGSTLDEARALVEICHRKSLTAAVNTQLRFAPQIAGARALIASGALGELYDLEIRVSVKTPWEMFPFVFGMERLEFTMHSVHYFDLVRSFLGNPSGVDAVTVGHPLKPNLASTRSTIMFRYGDRPIRVAISTNHDHDYGSRFEESFVKWEGTKGAVRAQLGLLLDYPRGGADALEYILRDEAEAGWRSIPFEGSWFPDAFIGSMGALQRYLEGSVDTLPTSVDDVLNTMAVIEAAYQSAAGTGVQPDYGAPGRVPNSRR